MIIHSPAPVRIVHDYDFLFPSGTASSITVDPLFGDAIEFGEKFIHIFLGPKPSLTDSGDHLPAEDIHITASYVVSYSHREREVTSRNDEQEEEWLDTLKEVSKARH